MTRVLIVPGLHNSGPGHWQSEWEIHLRHVHRIVLDDWDTPDLQAWIDAIECGIEQFQPTHIVAHSFGTLATAAVVANNASTLRGVLLVAPADPRKFDIDAQLPATALPVPGALVGSLTDPWLSWDAAQALGSRWGLETICAGDAGHINVQSGHGQWPAGWLILQRMLQKDATTLSFLRDHSVLSRYTQPRLRIMY